MPLCTCAPLLWTKSNQADMVPSILARLHFSAEGYTFGVQVHMQGQMLVLKFQISCIFCLLLNSVYDTNKTPYYKSSYECGDCDTLL